MFAELRSFQCNYTTAAGLKNIYEKSENLVPSFLESVSSDLRDLLTRLRKRNSSDRIFFEDYFNHPHLIKRSSPMRPKPLPSPREMKLSNYIEVRDEKKPSALPKPTKCNQLKIFNNRFSFNIFISSETSDDFVLVPAANLPIDEQCCEMNSSPPICPSTLSNTDTKK
ncbi:serine/threonine-protein kinase unc-51-like isoform X2 [Planococcus citri]|uniref:serine/threonine-protein kinase unc-51-like isoform X2 n=1 Tax=Planococcus citri TaxID=170843 RepID=UPI0031F939B1